MCQRCYTIFPLRSTPPVTLNSNLTQILVVTVVAQSFFCCFSQVYIPSNIFSRWFIFILLTFAMLYSHCCTLLSLPFCRSLKWLKLYHPSEHIFKHIFSLMSKLAGIESSTLIQRSVTLSHSAKIATIYVYKERWIDTIAGHTHTHTYD